MVELATLVAVKDDVVDADDAAPARKPRGRPKGSPKWPGSGRKKGSVNATTAELRARIHRQGNPIKAICDVAKGRTTIEGLSQGDAIKMLFKAVVPELRAEIVSGPDDGPVEMRSVIEATKRVSAAMAEAAAVDDPGVVMDDQALGAVQSINFITAAREAAQRKTNADPETKTAETGHTAAAIVTDDPETTDTDTAPVEPPAGDPPPPEIGHTLAFTSCDWRIRNAGPERVGLQDVFELRKGGSLARRGPFDLVLKLAKEQTGNDLGPWITQPPPEQHQTARPDQKPLSPSRPEVHHRRPR